MSNPYEILGIKADSDDATIRARYLELICQFSPEHHPEQFAIIRNAYEKLKDFDSRVRYRLSEAGKDETLDVIIQEVVCRTPKRRIGLKELIQAVVPDSNR